MPYKQRIFKEGRQKLFFENQSIPIDDMMSIPVPDFPGLEKKGRHMELLHRFGYRLQSSLTFCYESNIIIVESVDSTFSQELLHILQFYYIDQKFTPILMLIKKYIEVLSFSFRIQNSIPYQIIQKTFQNRFDRISHEPSDKEYIEKICLGYISYLELPARYPNWLHLPPSND